MFFVGIIGVVGVGKDIVVDVFCQEFGVIKIFLVDLICDMLEVIGIDLEMFILCMVKEVLYLVLCGKIVCYGLCLFGIGWGRDMIFYDIWVKVMECKIFKYWLDVLSVLVIILDVCFFNEVMMV